MTGHKVVDYIESINEGLIYNSIKPTFYHGEKSMQNLVADNMIFPITFLDHPITSSLKVNKYNEVDSEKYKAKILFALKSKFDWNMNQHDEVIAEMRSLAREFIGILFADKSLKEISIVGIMDIINALDVICSGVIVDIEITFPDLIHTC